MSIYIVKTMLCMALFLILYLFLLEKEKMHRFNRFYLLAAIVFSFTVPLISVTAKTQIITLPGIVNTTEIFFQNNNERQIAAPVGKNIFPKIILGVYILLTILLAIRFAKNMLILFFTIKRNTIIPSATGKFVLINEKTIPHSFLQYIFINRMEFENGFVEQEVLLHERTHTQQQHSLDIIFIELLIIIMWFNPFLYLYRKAIVLNHEFLADDKVVNTFKNTKSYQHLLIHKISRAASLQFANQFNYSVTKKRLIMLSKQTSPRVAIFKQIVLLPAIAGSIFLFSEKIVAQDSAKASPAHSKQVSPKEYAPEKNMPSKNIWIELSPGSTKEGVSDELLQEYESIINRYKINGEKPWLKLINNLSKEDHDRLVYIYKNMSIQQQMSRKVGFSLSPTPLATRAPTSAQLESFKNKQTYGVWIDGKKTGNRELNNFVNTDFGQVYVSKLYGAAKINKSYSYQVDLMTQAAYRNFLEEEIANRKNGVVYMYIRH